MRRILLSILILLALIFGFYYVSFFRLNNVPFTFESNIFFFKRALSSPVLLFKSLTPGTDENYGLKNQLGEVVEDETDEFGNFQPNIKNASVVTVNSMVNDIYNDMQNSHDEEALQSTVDWHPDVDLVAGKYFAKDAALGLVGLSVFEPSNVSISGNLQSFSLNCPIETSVLLSRDSIEITQDFVNIMEEFKQDDALFSYCSDDACSTLGRGCAILR